MSVASLASMNVRKMTHDAYLSVHVLIGCADALMCSQVGIRSISTHILKYILRLRYYFQSRQVNIMKFAMKSSTLCALLGSAGAFSTSLSLKKVETAFTSKTSLSASSLNRRNALLQTASACFLGVTSSSVVANADDGSAAVDVVLDASAMGSSPDHPIVVLGAGGRCGFLCTQILAKKGERNKLLTFLT